MQGVTDRRGTDSATALATLALDTSGLIRDCSDATEELFGYARDSLIGRHISVLLPALAHTALLQGDYINPHLGHLSHCGVPFCARRSDGEAFASEIFLTRLGDNGAYTLLLIVRKMDRTTLSWR